MVYSTRGCFLTCSYIFPHGECGTAFFILSVCDAIIARLPGSILISPLSRGKLLLPQALCTPPLEHNLPSALRSFYADLKRSIHSIVVVVFKQTDKTAVLEGPKIEYVPSLTTSLTKA